MKKEEATITALSNRQGSVLLLICNLTGSNQLTHVLPTVTSGTPQALQDPQVPAGAHPCGSRVTRASHLCHSARQLPWDTDPTVVRRTVLSCNFLTAPGKIPLTSRLRLPFCLCKA